MSNPTPTKEIITLESLNEKLEQVLKYQKHTRRMAIARFVFSLIFFIVFVVLPILGSVYLFQYVSEKIDVDQAKNQFIEFQDSINNLNEKSQKIDNLTDFESLKKLLK